MLNKLLEDIEQIMKNSGGSKGQIYEKAGISQNLLWAWQTRRTESPSLFHMICLVETLGYELTIKKVKDVKFPTPPGGHRVDYLRTSRGKYNMTFRMWDEDDNDKELIKLYNGGMKYRILAEKFNVRITTISNRLTKLEQKGKVEINRWRKKSRKDFTAQPMVQSL